MIAVGPTGRGKRRPSGGGGAVAEWVRVSTGDRTFDGSSPTSVKTFLFGTLAIPFTPLASVFRMRQ